MRFYVVVSSLLCAVAASQGLASGPSYLITDLGSLPWAPAIPRPGAVAGATAYASALYGQTGVDSQGHAYLYRNNTLTDLGILPNAIEYTSPPTSIGRWLNTMGHVAGASDSSYYWSFTSQSATHAVLWNGALIDLGTLSGPNYRSIAEGINDYDEIVGQSESLLSNGQVAERAFVWISGKMYNLTFNIVNNTNVRLTDATAIDCQGQIAAIGYSVLKPTEQHSYVLTPRNPRSCP